MKAINADGLQSKVFTGESSECQKEADQEAQDAFNKWLEEGRHSSTMIENIQFCTDSSAASASDRYEANIIHCTFTSSIFVLFSPKSESKDIPELPPPDVLPHG